MKKMFKFNFTKDNKAKRIFDKMQHCVFGIPENYSVDYDEDYKFIWGVQSWDSLSSSGEANFYTMNDIDIVYSTEENKYILGLETIYSFSNGTEGEINYLNSLLDKFTNWMIKNNKDCNYPLRICDLFDVSKGAEKKFDSIEECYAYFKVLVKGFTAFHKQKV